MFRHAPPVQALKGVIRPWGEVDDVIGHNMQGTETTNITRELK